MRQELREKLLRTCLRELKQYRQAAKGKLYAPSIYEWRRIDELKEIILELDDITNQRS